MGNRKLKPPACFAAVRRGKPAFAPSAMATVDPRCALAAPGKADLSLRCHLVGEGAKKSEKCEKSLFAIFHLEPVAVQSLPTKIACRHFSDFSKNSRGYTGGRGSKNPNLNPNPNLNGGQRMMNSICENLCESVAVERKIYRLLPLITAY